MEQASEEMDISCNTVKQKVNLVSQGVNVTEEDIQHDCNLSSNLQLKSIGIQTDDSLLGTEISPSTVASQTSDCGSSYQILLPVDPHHSPLLELKMHNAQAMLNMPEMSATNDGPVSSGMPLGSDSRRELWHTCRDSSQKKNEEELIVLSDQSSDDSDASDRPFHCTVCKKSFYEKHHLKRHMLIHSGERPFQCFLCSKGFTQKSHLERHVFVHSRYSDSSKCDGSILTDVSNFKPDGEQCKTNASVKESVDDISSRTCPQCNKVFINRYHVKRHMRIHLGVRPFQCNVCIKNFTQKEHLQRHIQTHSYGNNVGDTRVNSVSHAVTSSVQPDAAPLLPVEENANQNTVRMNGAISESSEENSVSQCPICSKVFQQKRNIKRHMMIHTGYRPYTCNVCQKTFNQTQHLERHVLTHTSDSERRASVSSESFELSSENGDAVGVKLEPEENSVQQLPEFSNQCSECQKTFASRYHLRRHLLIHSGVRPFQCPICSKGFTQREHLERHIRTHSWAQNNQSNESTSSVAPASVPTVEKDENVSSPVSAIKVECVLEYDNSEEYNTSGSENVEHQRDEQASDLPHKCAVCNKILSNKYHLKRHMLIHSGERPFQCQICPKNFTQKCHLERHMLTHSAVRCGVPTRDNTVSLPKAHEAKTSIPVTFEFLKAITESANGFSTVSAESLLSDTMDTNASEDCPNNVGKEMLLHSLGLDPSGKAPQTEREKGRITGVRHFLEDVVVCLPSTESTADPDSDDSGNIRPHECPVCHKTFIQKHHLKRHLMIHNNERPFQCQLCGKAFTQKQHLEKHTINKSCTKSLNSSKDKNLESQENLGTVPDSEEKQLTELKAPSTESDGTSAESHNNGLQMDTEDIEVKVNNGKLDENNGVKSSCMSPAVEVLNVDVTSENTKNNKMEVKSEEQCRSKNGSATCKVNDSLNSFNSAEVNGENNEKHQSPSGFSEQPFTLELLHIAPQPEADKATE